MFPLFPTSPHPFLRNGECKLSVMLFDIIVCWLICQVHEVYDIESSFRHNCKLCRNRLWLWVLLVSQSLPERFLDWTVESEGVECNALDILNPLLHFRVLWVRVSKWVLISLPSALGKGWQGLNALLLPVYPTYGNKAAALRAGSSALFMHPCGPALLEHNPLVSV